jgi:hypothetical protein
MCGRHGRGLHPVLAQARAPSRGRGGAELAFCQERGCEDPRLDVTLTGEEIRMLEVPFTPQTLY